MKRIRIFNRLKSKYTGGNQYIKNDKKNTGFNSKKLTNK